MDPELRAEPTDVAFDPMTESYVTYHDWSEDDSVSTSLILALADLSGVEATDVDALTDVVDAEALDRLVASLPPEGDHRVVLTLDGWEVTVEGNGAITFETPV